MTRLRTRGASVGALLIAVQLRAEPPPELPVLPFGFCIIPEMNYIPEVEGWSECTRDEVPEELKRATAAWKKSSPLVEKQVTPEMARQLSRWAKKEMEKYVKVPKPLPVELEPITANKAQGKFVFGCTLDVLPSHHPLVHRWLKAFILWDRDSDTVVRVTITIRGEALE